MTAPHDIRAFFAKPDRRRDQGGTNVKSRAYNHPASRKPWWDNETFLGRLLGELSEGLSPIIVDARVVTWLVEQLIEARIRARKQHRHLRRADAELEQLRRRLDAAEATRSADD